MADCSKCKFDDDQHCIGCENGSNFEHMSNADKIRSMDDVELADFLYGIDFYDDDGEYIIKIGGITIDDRKEDILDWLQSEAE